MTEQHYYEGIQHVVTISSAIGTSCEHCSESVGGWGESGILDLAKSINHYIEEHDYKLLHVGTETGTGPDGDTWHSTVAFLGM